MITQFCDTLYCKRAGKPGPYKYISKDCNARP